MDFFLHKTGGWLALLEYLATVDEVSSGAATEASCSFFGKECPGIFSKDDEASYFPKQNKAYNTTVVLL